MDSPHKSQWRWALMFSLICAWTTGWAKHRDAGDFRRHRDHYDITVIFISISKGCVVRRLGSIHHRQWITNWSHTLSALHANSVAWNNDWMKIYGNTFIFQWRFNCILFSQKGYKAIIRLCKLSPEIMGRPKYRVIFATCCNGNLAIHIFDQAW